jgi:hypothetical protein
MSGGDGLFVLGKRVKSKGARGLLDPLPRTTSPRLSPVVGLEGDRGCRAGVELSLNVGDDEPTLRIRDFDGLVDRRRSDVKDESTTAPLIDSYPPSNCSAPAIDRRSCAWRALFRTTAARSQIVNDLAVC